MNRRNFLSTITAGGVSLATNPGVKQPSEPPYEFTVDDYFQAADDVKSDVGCWFIEHGFALDEVCGVTLLGQPYEWNSAVVHTIWNGKLRDRRRNISYPFPPAASPRPVILV